MGKKPQGVITVEDFEGVVRALAAIGSANMHDRALGFGTPKHGALVGKLNAVWSEVVITAATDLTSVDVPHNLGSVPVLCELTHSDNPASPDVFFVARPVNQHLWTKSTAVVAVAKAAGAGTVVGARLTFRVGGA